MVFDFKKEYKEWYPTKKTPEIVTIPKRNFIAFSGQGDPNVLNGEYQKGIPLLYALMYTIKMSKNTSTKIPGYFDFVVPPLEGFWWQKGIKGVDITKKEDFNFISFIPLPDFVTEEVVQWAKNVATEKKKMDFSKINYMTYNEGKCVQCLHVGPFNTEIETVNKMHDFMTEKGFSLDISETRYHHEIYLGDVRKSTPEKLKTIIRHPIK